MKIYVFVDAENHYLRSVDTVRRIVDSPKAVEAFSKIKVPGVGYSIPRAFNGCTIGWNHELNLFWDVRLLGELISRALHTYPSATNVANRIVYVSSCVGDDNAIHDARVKIRDIGFEPVIIREPKDLYKQRQGSLESHKIIEKPKGCDIALVTRMVADAAANLYDCCCLFTSDADFLPAIEAVRRLGKSVIVGGYSHYLPERSPYLYMPDSFIDLEESLRSTWQGNKSDILAQLKNLGEDRQFS